MLYLTIISCNINALQKKVIQYNVIVERSVLIQLETKSFPKKFNLQVNLEGYVNTLIN